METILIGIASSLLTQIAKKTGIWPRKIAFGIAFILAVAYFIAQSLVDHETLMDFTQYFVTILGTATIVYNYIIERLLKND